MKYFSIVAFSACFGFTGCSGGTPRSLPVASLVTGAVVDDNGNPVQGAPVALAAWFPPDSPFQRTATTDAFGKFSFAAAPGHYLMRIGDDLILTGTPIAWTATVHDNVTLAAGNVTLSAPMMPPIAGIIEPPIQSSGSYRVSALSANEIACISSANAHRAQIGAVPFIVDQWLLEDGRNRIADPNLTSLQYTPPAGLSGRTITVGMPGPTCREAVDSAFLPSYVPAASALFSEPSTIWASVEFVPRLATFFHGSGVLTSEFERDPRTESASDTLYFGWP